MTESLHHRLEEKEEVTLGRCVSSHAVENAQTIEISMIGHCAPQGTVQLIGGDASIGASSILDVPFPAGATHGITTC